MSSQTDPGPLEQLRSATRSPLALVWGAAMGGAAPIVNFVTVHWGHLAWFDGSVHFARWDNPLWLMVAGTFALSASSVYEWGLSAYGRKFKAAGLVAMLEGALIMPAHPLLGYAALAFLVLINAASSGSALGLRDRADRAAVERVPSREAERVALDAPEVEASTATLTAPAPAHVELPAPKPAQLPPPVELDAGLYNRAVEVARGAEALSAAVLRRELHVRHNVAATLVERLVFDGVLAATTNAKGQRPVLLA